MGEVGKTLGRLLLLGGMNTIVEVLGLGHLESALNEMTIYELSTANVGDEMRTAGCQSSHKMLPLLRL